MHTKDINHSSPHSQCAGAGRHAHLPLSGTDATVPIGARAAGTLAHPLEGCAKGLALEERVGFPGWRGGQGTALVGTNRSRGARAEALAQGVQVLDACSVRGEREAERAWV